MQETTSAVAPVQLADTDALPHAVFRRAASDPDAEVLSRRVEGRWAHVTAREFAAEVSALAAGLVAAGVQPGDRVGLLSHTRYEWTLADYAIWTAGAVTVPVYETSSADQISWNLSDSGAVAVIVEGPQHAQTVASVRDQLPALREVWQIEAGGLEELATAGRAVPAADVEARRAALRVDDLATLIYTSGTTGRPKGCELTHRNLLTVARGAMELVPEVLTGTGSTLQFLPLAHVFARFVQVGCMEAGVRMGHSADIKNLLPDLAAFRPTFLLSVPRVFEKVHATARQRAHADGKGRLFDAAEQAAIAWSRAVQDGRVSLPLRLQHALFDRLVYGRLRAALGGQVQYAVSGGAPLGERLGHFFRGVGITVLEGYGLTETSAPSTVNVPRAIKIGTVGQPLPGVTLRIAGDGELLVKGDHLFRGYHGNPEQSAEALRDGWFHTGDLGAIDDDGFVSIVGRKKELIVTAGGKNVAPAVLEDRLRATAIIDQCMVVGDGRPFIAALVTLDEEALEPFLAGKGKRGLSLEQAATDSDVQAEVDRAVAHANAAVSRAEAIRKVQVLPARWTEQDGQITPSLKLKRTVVLAEHAADVDLLYA